MISARMEHHGATASSHRLNQKHTQSPALQNAESVKSRTATMKKQKVGESITIQVSMAYCPLAHAIIKKVR